MEQFICMIFIPIALLISGIVLCEGKFLFKMDNRITKFNEKHNIVIDETTYCKYQGMVTIKTGTSLLILDLMLFLLEVKDLKIIIAILIIWGILGTLLESRSKKKLVKELP